MSEAAANPEYNPSGVGDCIDTNKLPWIPIPNAPGMSIKPARASGEMAGAGFTGAGCRLGSGVGCR